MSTDLTADHHDDIDYVNRVIERQPRAIEFALGGNLEMLKLLLMNAYMSGINAEMRRALDIPIDAPILPGGAA